MWLSLRIIDCRVAFLAVRRDLAEPITQAVTLLDETLRFVLEPL